ncbi:tRNA (adenosine(37)-N6)-threonylcarbamoyltransferase complex ATPase subunit type 1 TsaE [Mycoplasma sp. 6243]|uniref:tRNA (adenosine(37)-N6)-threonylcarbamoyltransferase complex ATPase subunit type 1 TsaE n=1 Tax=Mycoplasma sp. 6243 TaxID=3440865 RepID=UPI003EBF687E
MIRWKNMKEYSFFANDLEQLKENIQTFLPIIKLKKYLLLSGELGAGKTTFVQVLGKLLGIKENITSPSFNYMKVYNGLVHIDLYTYKGDIDEFEDYFDDNIVAIEWPEKKNLLFDAYVKVDISFDNTRKYKIEIV